MAIRRHLPPPTLPHDNADFRRRFRRDVFRILKGGYDRLNHSRYQAEEEPAITGELACAARTFIEGPGAPAWAARYSVHDDPPVSAAGKRGKRRPRLDIQIERTGPGPHPRFGFEAKRLCKGHSGVAAYVGVKGLGALLDGTYCSEDDEAGMLGYVQSESEQDWADKLSSHFNKNASTRHICHGGEWREKVAITGLPKCFHTRHHRKHLMREITIYHLLLTFV